MEENNSDNLQLEPQQDLSLSDALAGVFSEPGATFLEVKRSKRSTYWIWPVIILSLITAFASFMVLNDEELSSEIKKTQLETVRENLDEAVKDGKMTREQADQQIESTKKMFSGGIFKAIGLAGGFFGVWLIFFLLSLVYWLVFKIFKGSGSFVSFMNVLGIASVISTIQIIINTVLAVFIGRLYINIGPIWFFTQEQTGKGLYKFIAAFDLLTIWYLVVIAIGFARISELKTGLTIPAVFSLWLLWTILSSFVFKSLVGV